MKNHVVILILQQCGCFWGGKFDWSGRIRIFLVLHSRGGGGGEVNSSLVPIILFFFEKRCYRVAIQFTARTVIFVVETTPYHYISSVPSISGKSPISGIPLPAPFLVLVLVYEHNLLDVRRKHHVDPCTDSINR